MEVSSGHHGGMTSSKVADISEGIGKGATPYVLYYEKMYTNDFFFELLKTFEKH